MIFKRAGIGRCLLPALLVVFAGCAGGENRPVARFGDHEISAREFVERYDSYLLATGARDNIVARKQVLDNMISETLILEDFHARRMDRSPGFLRRMEEVRRQALLDRFARSVSTDTIAVTEQELKEEYRASRTRVEARYLYASSREDALALKRRAGSGETFAVLSREVFMDPGLAANGGYLGTFGWGEMDPELERAAFHTPVGGVSDPVRIPSGWAIVKVESRARSPLGSETDYGTQREKLRRVILQRKVDHKVAAVSEALSGDMQAEFNPAALQFLHENRSWVDQSRVELEQPDPFTPEKRTLLMCRFRDTTWSVDDFLERASWLTEKQRRRIRTPEDIEAAAKGLAVRDAIIARARHAGFESDPDVLRQIGRMDLELRLKRWAAAIEDSVENLEVPEPALRSLFDSLKSELRIPPQVRVSEVLVRTRAEAEDVLMRVRSGEDFAAVARSLSIRLWAAREGGDLGWGSEAAFGILGRKFLSSRTGSFIGPEFVDPYFGVFTVTDRRAGRAPGFDEARQGLEERLAASVTPAAVRERITGLRQGMDVGVDLEALGNLEISQRQSAGDNTR
jgi:parvulin-like peptidyl-prolyl isomerase